MHTQKRTSSQTLSYILSHSLTKHTAVSPSVIHFLPITSFSLSSREVVLFHYS